jgi:hypothetical protein
MSVRINSGPSPIPGEVKFASTSRGATRSVALAEVSLDRPVLGHWLRSPYGPALALGAVRLLADAYGNSDHRPGPRARGPAARCVIAYGNNRPHAADNPAALLLVRSGEDVKSSQKKLTYQT